MATGFQVGNDQQSSTFNSNFSNDKPGRTKNKSVRYSQHMDKLTSLNLTLDRVIIQLVIPGLVAFLPWFIFFINHHVSLNNYLSQNAPITITTVTVVSLIVGLFLENFGGRIEILWFDRMNLKSDPEYKIIWDKYLVLDYQNSEPVGQRYLRNILLRMKFELSLGIAILFMIIGLFVLQNDTVIIESTFWRRVILYLLPFLTSLYLLCVEARSSSKVLARTRKLLVEKFGTA